MRGSSALFRLCCRFNSIVFTGCSWPIAGLAQILPQMAFAVAVKKVPYQPPIEIRSSEQPIRNWESQVHIPLHHDRLVMMRGVMPPDRVYKRAVAHEGILFYMTAEMHELIKKVHAGRAAHHEPAHIWRQQPAEEERARNRHQDKHD